MGITNDERGITKSSRRTKSSRGLVFRQQLPSKIEIKFIKVPNNYPIFEKAIKEWISNFVLSDTENPTTGKPWRRENILVENNDSLKRVWKKIEVYKGSEIEVMVLATMQMHRLKTGKPGVKQILFGVKIIPQQDFSFEEDVVEVTFVKKRWPQRKKDIDEGKKIIRELLKDPLKRLRKISSLRDIPLGGPPSSPKDILATKGNLIDQTLGSLIEPLTSHEAKELSEFRWRYYEAFAIGVASILDPYYRPSGIDTKFKEYFYNLGIEKAKPLSTLERYKLKMALIDIHRTKKVQFALPPRIEYYEDYMEGSTYLRGFAIIYELPYYSYRRSIGSKPSSLTR